MSYRALYRKYRPLTFEEVAGQTQIVQTLKNALKENKIAHAYLFAGPRGTGKTTMARLLAKALNCQSGFGHQCNKCESCLAINEGTHPDVIEIDAASNRGIDDIRDLISKIKYSPVLGKYKVYIIDEVHMMTTEAFNALLKTLEEPPANVVFILATTEPYKLMPTILSRVQRYDFDKVSDENILEKVKDILVKENVAFEEDALKEIISLADGGVRDTLSMVDQAIVYSDMNITMSSVEELFALTSKDDKLKLLLAIQNKDVAKLNVLLDGFISRGVDIRRLTSDLLLMLKDLLIYKLTKNADLIHYISKTDCEKLSFKTKEINGFIDVLINLTNQFKTVNNPRSLFEISLLKMVSLSQQEQVEIVKPIVSVNKEPTKAVETSNTALNIINNVDFSATKEIVDDGHKIEFTNEDILNIMVQANKEHKNKLNQNKSVLDRLLTIPNVGKYVQVLKSSDAAIVSLNAIIYVSRFSDNINKINLKENQIVFSKIHQAMLGHQVTVIALSFDKYQEMINKFKNLSQLSKLPAPHKIEIDTKLVQEESSTQKLAEELLK